MHRSYKILILYFLAFNALLLVSALIIFKSKIGFLPSGVLEYYAQKSVIGVFKVNLPHILLFGLFGMVLLHFLVFTNYKLQLRKLSFIFFASAFLELVSPLFIIGAFEFFSYVKILSFIVFVSVIIYISALLFFDIIND
jgi:hypothetical protein